MTNPLHIGIVIDQLVVGGVLLTAIKQVQGLNILGHKARLIILMRRKYSPNISLFLEGVPHEYLSDYYPLFFRNTVKFPIFSFLSTFHFMSPLFAPRAIRKDEFDIFIGHGTTTCLTVRSISHKLNIPYIAVIYDPFSYILEKAYAKTFLRFFFPILNPLAYFFESSFIREAKKTVIISQMHRAYLQDRYGIKPEVHTLGATGIRTLPKRRGDTLLAFGRWENKKNPFLLLEILKKLPGEKLVIAGSWTHQSEFRTFQATIRKNNLQDRIVVVPYYDKEILRILCSNARLFIHPHIEAFGIAALEAAGHGLPIVIPEKSGVTEILRHGEHGFFPKIVSADEYLSYVKTLLQNERLAYSMGEAAWRIVRARYSWELHVQVLLRLIRETIG